MSRIRTVKPDFWTSEQVMGCCRDSRLLFIGMWNFADDSGVLPASIQRIRAQVLPGDDISLENIRRLITELRNSGLIEEYDVEGKVYWKITGFTKHQRIDRPTYKHPLPDGTIPTPRSRTE